MPRREFASFSTLSNASASTQISVRSANSSTSRSRRSIREAAGRAISGSRICRSSCTAPFRRLAAVSISRSGHNASIACSLPRRRPGLLRRQPRSARARRRCQVRLMTAHHSFPCKRSMRNCPRAKIRRTCVFSWSGSLSPCAEPMLVLDVPALFMCEDWLAAGRGTLFPASTSPAVCRSTSISGGRCIPMYLLIVRPFSLQ